MKRLAIILGILILMSTMTGCLEKLSGDKKGPSMGNPVEQKGSEGDASHFQRPADYTITVSGRKISLFDWEDEIELNSIFGQPRFQETQELVNADTFSGSFLKTIQYNKTEVKLFSPKGDVKRFYVLDIRSAKEDLITDRGIKVGDSLDLVKQSYPEVKRSLDGTTGSDGSYEVMFNNDAYTYTHFLIYDGIVTEIRLYHEFA